ncbi:MAG TPA: 30S ribosomal protein S6--L-glutamate ligase, partial [Saprospiraceae bacterium]|nr:30S ribosomal protein S6--L-glutamate ligase [Saprospiraceae bacterium]
MNIVILSRNAALYSTNSLVSAALKRGHDVRVIDHFQCDLVLDNHLHEVYYNGTIIDDVDAIIPRIGYSATNYGASVLRQFEAKGIYSTLSASSLLLSRDKLSCLQTLISAGISVPRTGITNN